MTQEDREFGLRVIRKVFLTSLGKFDETHDYDHRTYAHGLLNATKLLVDPDDPILGEMQAAFDVNPNEKTAACATA